MRKLYFAAAFLAGLALCQLASACNFAISSCAVQAVNVPVVTQQVLVQPAVSFVSHPVVFQQQAFVQQKAFVKQKAFAAPLRIRQRSVVRGGLFSRFRSRQVIRSSSVVSGGCAAFF